MGNISSESVDDEAPANTTAERQAFAALCVLITVVGTVGNLSVVVCVAMSKKLQTVTNVFVVNLAVADLMTCLCLPWQAVSVLGDGHWPIEGALWLCQALPFVQILTMGCSINTLALIAVNR